jgi:hypothetical protein
MSDRNSSNPPLKALQKKCPRCGVEHVPSLTARKRHCYACRDCRKAQLKAWRLKNADRIGESQKIWRANNRERVLIYAVWQAMLARCYNPGHDAFDWYGGRGVRVCDRWRSSFDTFLSDMGPRPSPAHQIDRVENDGHYEPSNCRWTDRRTQCRNRRSNRLIEYDGQVRTLTEWAEVTGIGRGTIESRIDRNGWSVERALTEMPQQNRDRT